MGVFRTWTADSSSCYFTVDIEISEQHTDSVSAVWPPIFLNFSNVIVYFKRIEVLGFLDLI